MGFWHTGYMEHHEDAFFSAFIDPREPVSPPVFPCPDCTRTFLSPEELEVHRFDGHSYTRPVLLLNHRECGRSRFTISEPTAEPDWAVLDASSILVNGEEIPPSKAGSALSSFHEGVVRVVLKGEQSNQSFDLRFAITDYADLQGVDDRLHEMVRGHRLTIGAIEGFLSATEAFRTAGDYRAGIANYLYGVLAREKSPESGLKHDEYRERFDQAVALLGGFDRQPADAICGLVAFHYNQFDHAILRTRSARVSWAARRFLHLLEGMDLDVSELVAPERSSIDYVLSDALTEQVLTWASIPLDGTAHEPTIAAIEEALLDHEPFDQLKLRIVTAEYQLRKGSPETGRKHAAELRHNPVAEEWARTYLNRAARGNPQ